MSQISWEKMTISKYYPNPSKEWNPLRFCFFFTLRLSYRRVQLIAKLKSVTKAFVMASQCNQLSDINKRQEWKVHRMNASGISTLKGWEILLLIHFTAQWSISLVRMSNLKIHFKWFYNISHMLYNCNRFTPEMIISISKSKFEWIKKSLNNIFEWVLFKLLGYTVITPAAHKFSILITFDDK